MEWFERWFGEEYLLVYEHRNIREAESEAQAINKFLDLKENDLILDLCCGPGRHDTFFVRMGYRIYGIDFSMPMLKIASEAIPIDKKYPRYIRGDVRNLPFGDGIFDAVLNLFTSFGYFDDDGNQDLIRAIARILKPGGHFFIDYLNPEKVMSELVEKTTKEKEGIKIIEERKLDLDTRRVEKTITLNWDNNSQTFHESVRLYKLEEMLSMIESAGFKTKNVFGSMNGEPYGKSSERMIVLGSKG